MDKNLDLVAILKNYPTRTKLYSPLFGEVTFIKIDKKGLFPIVVRTSLGATATFSAKGQFYPAYENSECLLFHSKDKRDWEEFMLKKPKFDHKTLQPYDDDSNIIMTKEQKDLLLQIPNKLEDTIRLYVDGVFVDRLDVNQVNQYIINVLKYIYETGDSSILNRFYFVGHKDTDATLGEEIKMEMDDKSNFSDLPYEMAHVRRHMRTLMEIERKRFRQLNKKN